MANNSIKNRLAALAIGAPLVTVGFVGLGAAPASATLEDGTDIQDIAVGILESNVEGDVNVYESPAASANVIDYFGPDQPLLVSEWASEGTPYHTVYLNPSEDRSAIGYVLIDSVNVAEDFDGTYNEDAAEGELDNGNGNGNGAGDEENGDGDVVVEEEWDIDLEDTDDFDVIEEEEEGDDIDGSVGESPEGSDGEESGFTETDEDAGDPIEIESGFIGGGDSSNPAGLALLGLGGVALASGGALVLVKRQEQDAAKAINN